MPSVTVAFCRRFNFARSVTRVMTGGALWSHCGIVVGDAVVEALTKGVVMTPVNDWVKRYPSVDFVNYECPDPKAAEDFALAQVGKPYDWIGCFGAPWRSHWQDPAKWYCSELCVSAIAAGGRHLFRREKNGITPMELWNVL